ncbi:MAG: hypothetical protein ING75_16490 [Rhodocyclaceae bacterium]|nr:hypothetical protein [Rhodocyclaceae bacterium]
MKILKWQVFAGVLLLTGIADCIYLVVKWRNTLEFGQEIALQGESLSRLERARKSGDDAAYENALREHITHLQTHFQSAERVFGTKATVNDTALAYARLSVLAKNVAQILNLLVTQLWLNPFARNWAGRSVLRRKLLRGCPSRCHA